MCTFYYHYHYAVCGCVLTASDVPRGDRRVYVVCSQGRFYPADRCPNYTSGPDDTSVTAVCAGMCPDCRKEAAARASELALAGSLVAPLTEAALAAVNRHPPTTVENRVEAWLDRIAQPSVPSYMQEELRAIAAGMAAGTTEAPMTTPPTTTAPLALPQLFPSFFSRTRRSEKMI